MATGSRIHRRLATRLGLGSSGLLLTPEEFDRIPEGSFEKHLRYELINGVLVVTPPPGNGEMDPNEELGYMLRFHRKHHPQGSVIDKTLMEQTIDATPQRRRADRAIWIGLGRVPDLAKDIPAIVVEFVSKSRRDFIRYYEAKRAEYLGIGVREYWIIDRFRRIMTVYLNHADGIATVTLGEAETYRTDLLPGFELPLSQLLAQADDWSPQDQPRPKKNRDRPQKPLEGEPR